jgi:DNA-binding beta-propeller fold protein YncE
MASARQTFAWCQGSVVGWGWRACAAAWVRLSTLAAGSDTWTKLPPPGGVVAVDAAGNVYVVHFDGGGLMKLAPGSSSWTRLPPVTSFRMAGGVAVDARGNVYVTDNLSGDIDPAVAKNQGVVVKVPAT